MVKKTKAEYNNESIRKLSDRDAIRKKPGVNLGSNDVHGCEHAFFEILSNSLDEYKSGYGDYINVTRKLNGVLEVQDFGRGCPVDFNKIEQVYNWELIFCTLYAGGKCDDDNEIYEDQLGTNGLGTASAQLSSEFFDVEIIRDGYQYNLHFEKGINIDGLKKKKLKKDSSIKTGTKQTWKPDLEVFTDIDISIDFFKHICKQQAIINNGVHILFHDEETNFTEDYFYPDGILGYVRELNDNTGIIEPVCFNSSGRGQDTAQRAEYDVKFEMSFCFNNNVNKIEYYHNSSFLEYGGSPDKALKKAFTEIMDKQIALKGKYNKSERKVKFEDIQDSLICICNSFSSSTSYENQTKKSINNKFIQTFMIEKIKENLEIWFLENKIEGDKVIEQILANKRSSESAERQRVTAKKKLMSKMDMNNRVKKLTPCRSTDNTKTELFIVEGDSAGGSGKQGRNSEFQAIMPIRGKILNCIKSDINKIYKSDIIMDLIRVIGCGIELHGKRSKSTFNLDNLRYDKIIIMTDADIDGDQIKCLVLTMLYKLCPTLITTGHVYIVKTPLFEITIYEKNGDEKTIFTYNDAEQQKMLKKLKNKKIRVQRSKGLGENSPEMMWESTMNPETRHLIRVKEEDAKAMEECFELFLGSNIQERKKYIENFGYLYINDLDLN